MAEGPLHGVRVLEFSVILAGPYTGMALADMGADVIKVEPLEGEPRRNNGLVPGTSRIFQWVNRGKRTIQIDLRDQAGKDAIYRLVRQVDVVIDNYRPGVPKRLGVDYDTLKQHNPRIIYVNISGFGSKGPMAGAPGADAAAVAYSGAAAANGKIGPSGAPEGIGGMSLGDAASGLAAAMGVCAALYHRERTGEGQYLETSLVHAILALASQTTMRDGATDRASREPILRKYAEIRANGGTYADFIKARAETAPIARRGSNYFTGYLTKDGAITFSANTAPGRLQIRGVLGFEGAGTDDPAVDIHAPEFPDMVKQEKADIERVMRTRTTAEWMKDFRAAGAPVAPVLLPEEVCEDEQGSVYFEDLVHSVTGPERHVKPVITFEKTPARIQGPADMPGDHGAEILRDYGFTEDEIRTLHARGLLLVKE